MAGLEFFSEFSGDWREEFFLERRGFLKRKIYSRAKPPSRQGKRVFVWPENQAKQKPFAEHLKRTDNRLIKLKYNSPF